MLGKLTFVSQEKRGLNTIKKNVFTSNRGQLLVPLLLKSSTYDLLECKSSKRNSLVCAFITNCSKNTQGKKKEMATKDMSF